MRTAVCSTVQNTTIHGSCHLACHRPDTGFAKSLNPGQTNFPPQLIQRFLEWVVQWPRTEQKDPATKRIGSIDSVHHTQLVKTCLIVTTKRWQCRQNALFVVVKGPDAAAGSMPVEHQWSFGRSIRREANELRCFCCVQVDWSFTEVKQQHKRLHNNIDSEKYLILIGRNSVPWPEPEP
jgi:hypothetical protein